MMKKLTFVLFFILIQVASFAQDGVKFRHLTFKEALECAVKENKPVFMDCYTTWCGPCQFMLKNVFSQKRVGDVINNNYIAVKFDMEQPEGKELKKQYQVSAYPTFLIINPDGSLFHRIVGGSPAEELLAQLGVKANVTTTALEKKYKQGERGKDFMVEYLKSLQSINSPDIEKVADELYQLLSDREKTDPKYWFIIKDDLLPEKSAGRIFFQNHRKTYYKRIGDKEVKGYLDAKYNSFMTYFKDLYDTPCLGWPIKSILPKLDKMEKEILSLKLDKEAELMSHLKISRSLLKDDYKTILDLCEKEMLNIDADTFPFFALLGAKFPDRFTDADKAQLKKIGTYLIKNAKDASFKEKVQNCIKNF